MRYQLVIGLAISALTGLSLGLPPPLPEELPKTELQLKICNVFGFEKLKLHHPYTTLLGDTVELTRYAYYLSNIYLKRSDGLEWRQPASVHLLETPEQGTADFSIPLTGMPEGDYTEISFAVGLDSLLNHSSNRAGTLNPDFGMFWEWESNYVFLKCEGHFRKIAGGRGAFVFHVAHDACYRKVKLGTGRPLTISSGQRKSIEIKADARQLFGGFAGAGLTLKLTQPKPTTSIMSGDNSIKLANNYAHMFAVGKVATPKP